MLDENAFLICGMTTSFIPLIDDIAIKLFQRKEEAYTSYNRQKQAAQLGLGPEVYDQPFEVNGRWSFLTEIVECCDPNNHWGSSRDVKKLKDETEEMSDLMKGLQDELKPIFNFGDCHLGNVGWKNGVLVCIDFGE